MIKKYDEFIKEEFFWKKKELDVDIELNRFFGRMKAVQNLMDMYRNQGHEFWENPEIRKAINDSSESLGDFMRSANDIIQSMDKAKSEISEDE